MAEDFEIKLEALKKAYAELILNSSKEAAARIMAAEHKARCFEQQLVSLREDSISMLCRLNDQFNSMVKENEAKSLKQQMKVDELEAQLNEAEGIIVDLRSELNQVREQLDIEKKTLQKALNERNVASNEPVQGCVLQDKVPSISQVPDIESEKVDNEKKVASVHPVSLNRFLHTVNVKYCESRLDQFHAANDEFSSIIMQNRDSDLYKNGCTQRIRAFEGNFSKVRTPASPSEDKDFPHVRPLIHAKEAVSHRRFASDENRSCLESLCSVDTDKGNVRYVPYGWLKKPSSSCKHQTLRSRRSARKNSKYRGAIASLQGSNTMFGKARLKPFHTSLKRCSSGVDVEAVEIPIGLIELDPKNFNFCHVLGSNDPSSINENTAECTSSNKSHGTPDDTLLDSALVDVPISEGFGSSHCQSSRADKFLKFTFQRRPRKHVVGKIDENQVPIKRLENPNGISNVESM